MLRKVGADPEPLIPGATKAAARGEAAHVARPKAPGRTSLADPRPGGRPGPADWTSGGPVLGRPSATVDRLARPCPPRLFHGRRAQPVGTSGGSPPGPGPPAQPERRTSGRRSSLDRRPGEPPAGCLLKTGSDPRAEPLCSWRSPGKARTRLTGAISQGGGYRRTPSPEATIRGDGSSLIRGRSGPTRGPRDRGARCGNWGKPGGGGPDDPGARPGIPWASARPGTRSADPALPAKPQSWGPEVARVSRAPAGPRTWGSAGCCG